MLTGTLSIVDVGNLFTDFMNYETGGQVKSPSNPAKDIYSLLDIDSKGYISDDDIESFLNQLKDADIDCL